MQLETLEGRRLFDAAGFTDSQPQDIMVRPAVITTDVRVENGSLKINSIVNTAQNVTVSLNQERDEVTVDNGIDRVFDRETTFNRTPDLIAPAGTPIQSPVVQKSANRAAVVAPEQAATPNPVLTPTLSEAQPPAAAPLVTAVPTPKPTPSTTPAEQRESRATDRAYSSTLKTVSRTRRDVAAVVDAPRLRYASTP